LKLCPKCDQAVAEEITACPSCGTEIGEGRRYIDDYRIVDVLHEGYASFLCRAIRQRTGELVMIRLFTPQSGVTEEIASRLRHELEELKKLPGERFVRHYAIRQAPDGLWYRISEWLDTVSWGSLLASGRLKDRSLAFDLLHQIATILSVLHSKGYFIPHLILNDIILVKGDREDELKVKIDYKFSRFFDPKLDRPGPMLKKLLECHPDIVNGRPLDFRSDIWSLGKIFVEILTADLSITDFASKIDDLQVPREAKILFKVMLADDPDLRPRSMHEVVGSLGRIKKETKETQGVPDTGIPRSLPGLKPKRSLRRIALLASLLFLVAVAFLWFRYSQQERNVSAILETYANKYSKSIAFLVVEYWLDSRGKRVYRNRSEGTAFLVDREGYMLTSRHVACPWLEDTSLFTIAEQLKKEGAEPRFDYRMLLWFEGTKAFNRAARLMEDAALEDIYLTDTAYSRRSRKRITIAGIPKPPVLIRQLISSPFKDDFALLKIAPVPDGIMPLPLDPEMDPKAVPKLSPFITLGFPLGSRTQETTVNASVTSGNVRRSFEHLLQVDASIYGGNSGGPIVDARGKIIGIVSGVATEMAQGLLPIPTPRWDIGMVLPITGAAEFLQDLKAGKTKWNGALDFSLEEKLKKLAEEARKGHWSAAQAMADRELKENLQPQLVTASAMMHLCNGDFKGARERFSQSLSMDPRDMEARLMLFMIDWLADRGNSSAYRDDLLGLDWRSEHEFQGYLARVIEGLVDEGSALEGWYTSSEKSWLFYVVGMKSFKKGALERADGLLRQSLLSADTDSWEFYLALSKLRQVQKLREGLFQREKEREEYRRDKDAFDRAISQDQEERKERKDRLSVLTEKLSGAGLDMEEKIRILQEVHKLYPDSPNLLVALAFYYAADESWDKALDYARSFLERKGRSNSSRMSLGLLEPCVMHFQKRDLEARSSLSAFLARTEDPWYSAIARVLLKEEEETILTQGAEESPENLITAYTFLGFWKEGSGDKEGAIAHYRRALESFLDTWLEYDFIRERFKRLKKSESEPRR